MLPILNYLEGEGMHQTIYVQTDGTGMDEEERQWGKKRRIRLPSRVIYMNFVMAISIS